MKTVGEYDQTWFSRQTPLKLLFKGIGVFVVLSGVVMILAFSCGWIKTGADIISPQNVKKQWQFAYDYRESMNATARQWCSLKKEENAATDPDVKTQRASQRLAQETNYSRLQGVYDGRLSDAFRAKLVKPSDVPYPAPTLDDTVAELNLHCD